jgi:hypothetical protein
MAAGVLTEPEVIGRIEELDATGLYTQRQMAEMTGACLDTVRRVCQGKYQPKALRPRFIDRVPFPPLETDGLTPAHCDGCGGSYYGETCYLCWVRNH